MTAEAFNRWLADMKSAGLARSEAECGRLLDVAPNTLTSYKRRGGSRSLALACRALLHRLTPYGD